jgi:hypothetical protein
MTSLDAIERVIDRFDSINKMSVVRFGGLNRTSYDETDTDRRFERRRDEISRLYRRAKRTSDRRGLPFWDVLLAMCFLRTTAEEVDFGPVFDRALLHNIPRPVGTATCILELRVLIDNEDRKDPSSIIGIESRVRLSDGTQAHIPMLDFHCKEGKPALAAVEAIIASLGVSGFVLASGRSYHFVGDTLINDDEWMSFLGKAILLAPFIDRAWVGHQLLQRTCVLRVNSGPKYETPPVVCGYVS